MGERADGGTDAMRRTYGPAALGAAAAVWLALAAGPAVATNGYIANGYGGGSKGMAGAGVAVGSGVLGLAQNPAHGAKLGNSAGLCFTFFSPSRDVTIGGAAPLATGKFESENEFFLIPCGGANFRIDERSAFGVYAYGNGGLNTEYDVNFFGGSSPLGVDLMQGFVALNYAREVAPGLHVGGGPVLAIQRFEARGLEPFAGFSADPANLTNNGHEMSYGGGAKIGVLWDANDHLTLGASYQTRMWMTPFDDYAGLFAEQGDFDVPPIVTLGLAVRPAPATLPLTVTVEWQRIFYGDVASVSNSGNAAALGAGNPLGSDDGPGFGWDDMDVLRVAAVYEATDALTLRAGASWNTQFADDDEVLLNTLAPATPRVHLSVGFSYEVGDGWGVTGSYTHAFSETVSGSNPAFGGQPIDLRMDQHEVSLGVTYRW